ncbi:McKusick-Kaufman/Bardet-Biedl syndromes putative chaperonin-like [Gigantopelta aegis]|uniref:McKusick-Kaufman/Bardet-Biedl syndromes putative chaperonin-like n=1 Tax=Gigantopelta aegis TaxID=1735272 RepID=UPI001B88DEA6|nr:McKusick-Kaufman/Bardet-Biedl syndromes putative chaperonin-like [Gigantopelta aegis]XP_041353433.1 McKusick-Kaufman/Bardet-Biedl syndromes putative chaperonin-like [Gigantopelta aegis]
MSRLLSKNIGGPATLHIHHLDDAKTRTCLTQFRDLVGSCRGPSGKIKMIQNKVGGHLTLTSTSSRLLAAMSFSHPVLQMVVGSTQNHLANFKDGGLLLCHFCLLLLESSLDKTWNRRHVVAVYENCLSKMEEYLSSSDCVCRFEVSISSIDEMMSFLHCILSSKPLCCLGDAGLDHLSKTILRSFLHSIPESTQRIYFSDRIYIQCMSNNVLLDSKFEKGILMICPELSSIFEQNIEVKKTVDYVGVEKIKVALVNVSMSGDAEELMDVHYEADRDVDVNESMLSAILNTCEGLVQRGVGMVLSQKVIHPRIKAYLRSCGVFFLDRIGALLMPYLRDVTGATPLSSVVIPDFGSSSFGWLDDAVHCVLSGKSYLHLTNTDSPVVSLVLCSPLEEACSELQCLCSSALLSLKRLVHSGSVLCGGGCWQTHLAAVLRSQMDDISNIMNLPTLQLTNIVENFARCLEKSATSLNHDQEMHMVDKSQGHLWKTTYGTFDQNSPTKNPVMKCSCSLLSTHQSDDLRLLGDKVSEKSDCDSTCTSNLNIGKNPQIVDSLAVALSAVQTAVYTANSILMTHQYIQDEG